MRFRVVLHKQIHFCSVNIKLRIPGRSYCMYVCTVEERAQILIATAWKISCSLYDFAT